MDPNLEMPMRPLRHLSMGLAACAALTACAPPTPPPAPGATWLSKRGLAVSDPTRYYLGIGAIQGNQRDTLAAFMSRNGFVGASPPGEVKALYFNAGDLNLARDMRCRVHGARTACYVSNHFSTPPQPGRPFDADDQAALRVAMSGAAPAATVAMESEPVTDTDTRRFAVRECDGVATNPPGDEGGGCRPDATSNLFPAAPRRDVDTGIDLRRGDRVRISASGGIHLPFVGGGTYGPDGRVPPTFDPFPLDPQRYPDPGAPLYSLLARIGEGGPLRSIGSLGSFTYQGAGARLFLLPNHDRPGIGWGAWQVEVRVQRSRTEVRFYAYGSGGQLLDELALDSQGAKKIPGMCMACHGGHYDPVSHSVRDASFLPFVPGHFRFAAQSGLTRADQEDALRRLNMLVLGTRPPGPDAITEFVQSHYGGAQALGRAGSTFNDLHVPGSWQSKAALYRSVVRPYCLSCHLALDPPGQAGTPSLTFRSAGDFEQLAYSVLDDVCARKTMPHAEVPYRNFWLTQVLGVPLLPLVLRDELDSATRSEWPEPGDNPCGTTPASR